MSNKTASSVKNGVAATDAEASKIHDFTTNKPGTRVTLVAEGKEIRVNKEILSFHSSYFKTLLQSPNFIESKSDRIEIEHDYDLLLKCMTIAHGNPPIPNGEMKLSYLHRLLQSADFFDLTVVHNYCQSELLVRRKDLVRAFILASHFGLTKIKKFLFDQITRAHVQEWMNRNSGSDQYGEKLDIAISIEDLRSLMILARPCAQEAYCAPSTMPLAPLRMHTARHRQQMAHNND